MNFFFYFKSIKFHHYKFKTILLNILSNGGYLVAPAASALVNITKDKLYYDSLKKADVAILDSGFFCILLKLLNKIRVKKMSGYFFLKNFISSPEIKKCKILTIDPDKDNSKANTCFLYRNNLRKHKSYISPFYKKNLIQDFSLLRIINTYKPNIILINIGGGKQEILANFIIRKIKFKTTVLCLGAAIGFLTKKQANITPIHDKYYLGWFKRICHHPKFIIRVFLSLRLISFFKIKF